MGISKFIGWIKQTYPESVSNIEYNYGNFFDHVYIDINVILHRIISISTTEDELLSRLCIYIDNVLKHVIPLKSITIASDGIAPFAKIILQRERRRTYARNHKDNLPEINPLCFTPGTYFMESLKFRLSEYINKLKKIYKVNVNLLTDESGEAELKLINTMVKNNNNNNTSHCIYSSDADIIVIIAAACINNVTVHNGSNFLKIDKIIEQHQKKLTIKNKIKSNISQDFAFTSLLMGNDYIPKLAYVTVDRIWSSYIDTFNSLGTYIITEESNNYVINTKFIIKMLQNLVTKVSKQWISVFKLENFNIEAYTNYVFGLIWCFDSYKKGTCDKLDYMCDQMISIHPLGLLYFFEFGYYDVNHYNNNKIGNNYDIDNEIYATLILPKCARNLINYTKDIDFGSKEIANKIAVLYDIENCEICDEYHRILSDLNKTDPSIVIKNNITQNLKKYKEHNVNNHKDITIDVIIDLINIMKKIQKPYKVTPSDKIKHEPIKLIKPIQKFKQVYLF